MAEKKEMLVASNGCKAFFTDPLVGEEDDSLWLDGRWPLDEFDELVEFVAEHQNRGEMKLSELEASDETQTEG